MPPLTMHERDGLKKSKKKLKKKVKKKREKKTGKKSNIKKNRSMKPAPIKTLWLRGRKKLELIFRSLFN